MELKIKNSKLKTGTVAPASALLILNFAFCIAAWAVDNCTVCGGRIERVVYFFKDKVTGDKKEICEKCAKLPAQCYLCGLPAKDNFTELPDGRVLCARDVKNVVLDEDEAQKIWHDVREAVERQLSRFVTFTEQITVHPLDRVDLQAMFKFAGNDFVCPNVWGCTQRQTNDHRVSFKISLLRGLPPPVLKATCAHELAHTWVSENISPARKETLNPDAVEGFCELVACLLMEAQHEEKQTEVIRNNAYTRGQFALFREAEKRFGFNEIVEWMKFGVDPQLSGAALDRVREVKIPAEEKAAPVATAASTSAIRNPTPKPPAPDKLTLNGITWSKTRPMALINGRTFEVQEEARVQLGQSNVAVRCLTITADSVVIQVAGEEKPQTLRLKEAETLKR